MKTHCTTCGNPVEAPKKRIRGGKIVEQCVDKCHDKHVLGIPSNQAEFLRNAIKRFRKAGVKRFDSNNPLAH